MHGSCLLSKKYLHTLSRDFPDSAASPSMKFLAKHSHGSALPPVPANPWYPQKYTMSRMLHPPHAPSSVPRRYPASAWQSVSLPHQSWSGLPSFFPAAPTSPDPLSANLHLRHPSAVPSSVVLLSALSPLSVAAVCVLHPILVLSEIHPPVYPSAVPHQSVQAPASHLPKQYLLLSAVLPHRSIPAFLHRSEFPVSAEYPSAQSVPPSVPAEDLVHLQAALPAGPFAASAPETGHSSVNPLEKFLLSAALQAVQDFPDSGDQKL